MTFETRQIGPATLILGDCLEVLPTLPAEAAGMVFADPPYGTTRCAWDAVVPLEPMWAGLHHATPPEAALVFTAQLPFDKVLGASNISQLRHEWIWEKPRATGHLNVSRGPMKAHENVLIFSRQACLYQPIKTDGHILRNRSRPVVYQSDCYGSVKTRSPYRSTERYPRSIIEFGPDNANRSLHPTQKPVALVRYMVATYSRPGETVLDPFMGSGTTGEAALREGRRFIGIERERKYFEIACARLEAVEAEPALPLDQPAQPVPTLDLGGEA